MSSLGRRRPLFGNAKMFDEWVEWVEANGFGSLAGYTFHWNDSRRFVDCEYKAISYFPVNFDSAVVDACDIAWVREQIIEYHLEVYGCYDGKYGLDLFYGTPIETCGFCRFSVVYDCRMFCTARGPIDTSEPRSSMSQVDHDHVCDLFMS